MQDLDGLKKATDATTNSHGALNKAYMDSLTPLEQWQQIQNLGQASMIKLGEKILPYVTSALEKLAPLFEWIYQNIDTIIPVAGAFIGVLTSLSATIWAVNFAMSASPLGIAIVTISALIAIIVLAIKKYNEWGATLLWFLGPIGRVISALKLIYDHWNSIKQAFNDGGIIGGITRIGQVLMDVILQPIEQLLGLISKLPGSLGQASSQMQNSLHGFREKMNLVDTPAEKAIKERQTGLEKMKQLGYESEADMWLGEQAKAKAKENMSLYNPTVGGKFSDSFPTNDKDKKGKSKLGSDIDRVKGAAKEVKNITIKFDSVHRGNNIINNGGGKGMSMEDFENFYNELMMRIIRNAEMS